MKLVFLSGPLSGTEIEVEEEVVLGREGTDVEIEDSAVSRQHARFRHTDDGLEVADLDSTNGTYVNSDKITGPRKVAPGDFVSLGGTTLEVRGDWRSAETQVIAAPPAPVEERDEEEYVPTSPITVPPRPDRPANLRPVLLGVGVVGLILVLGVWFASRGSDGFAAEADAVCRKARTDASSDSIRGNNVASLKPAARKLLQARTKVREDLADLEADADIAPRFGDFLARYADTNDALRRVSTLQPKTRTPQVRRAVGRVRSSVQKENELAKDLGFEVCGGLPI